MKFCIFDTETSGLTDFRKPADDPCQPRLAQFSAILLDDMLTESGRINMYAKPDGWAMQPGAMAINGLTDEFLSENGVPVRNILDRYAGLIDDGYILAAYNAQFDMKVMRGEMRRAGVDDRFEKSRNTCLMRACGKLKIPKASGRGGWPKLSDACSFFDVTNPNAHDAMGDAEAALGIFHILNKRGQLIEPQVHYAKNPPAGRS